MSKTYTLNVPTSLDDISLDQYQRYVKVITENKEDLNNEFIKLKVLEIFCGLSLKDAYELAAVDVDEIVNLILTAINHKPPLQRRFTMEDPAGKVVEFGFIPNLERISQGEYIDAELLLGNWDKMHEAMAVLYRPITGSKGEFYEIEKYESPDKYAVIMRDAPASVALGAMVFFYHLGTALLNATLTSLVGEDRMDLEDLSQLENLSEESGDGTVPYTHLLEEMYSKLNKLQNDLYTSASYGLNMKKSE